MQAGSLPAGNLSNELQPFQSNSESVKPSGNTLEPDNLLTGPPKKKEHYRKKGKGKGKDKSPK